MPLRDFDCPGCGHKLEGELIRNDEDLAELRCPNCGGAELQQLLTGHGGYKILGNNSASQRPKGAGSFRGGKK